MACHAGSESAFVFVVAFLFAIPTLSVAEGRNLLPSALRAFYLNRSHWILLQRKVLAS
jgi:hypothetical protein